MANQEHFAFTTTTIHIDESGYTGSDLLNPDQRFFAVASTDLSHGEAGRILSSSFAGFTGNEFKATRVFKGKSYQRGIIRMVEHIANNEARFFAYVIDKRFCVLTKLVDFLIEPIFRSQGYDFYANSFAPKYVNLLHASFDSEQRYLSTLEAYQNFAKKPSRRALEDARDTFIALYRSAPPNLQSHLGQALNGLLAFERFYNLETFGGSSNLHLPCAICCLGFWREKTENDIIIEHDESSEFFKGQTLWDLVTSANANSGELVGSYGRITQFPLRVRSTIATDSRTSASIQLCDLIAGMLTRIRRWQADGRQAEFVRELFAAGLQTLNCGEIGFAADFPSSTPKRLDGPDAVDQFINLALRR